MAIRVLCAEESYKEKDFAETQVILKTILDYANAIKKVGECSQDGGSVQAIRSVTVNNSTAALQANS